MSGRLHTGQVTFWISFCMRLAGVAVRGAMHDDGAGWMG